MFSYLWIGTVSGLYLVSERPDQRKITITSKDFTSDYIPYSSSSTFSLPADSDFIADDTDNLWFTAGVPNSVSVSDLADSDYSRTLVKCSHEDPYDITAIGLLRNALTLTASQTNQIHQYFQLWIYWSGYYNDYGYLKDNRLLP